MPHSAEGLGILIQILALLAATVIMAPLARRFGLSAIVGYLAAGIAIGPWGLQHKPTVQPEPLTGPRRAARPLSPDTEEAIKGEKKTAG